MNRAQSVPPAGLSRRRLFTQTAAAGGLAALAAPAAALTAAAEAMAGPGHSGGPPGSARRAGIQLYTLRASMAEEPRATLTAVAGMGYDSVEFAGYHGVAPQQLREWLDELNLAAPAAHIDPGQLRDDPEPLLEAAATLGHDHLIIAWLGEEDRQGLDDYRGWAEVLNRAGEAGRDMGIRMAYHNHDFEFAPLDGVMPLALLLEETDPGLVDFELDFFWVHKAGLKVGEVLTWAPERFTLAHIKDMSVDGAMVDVGTGVIEFAGLLNSEVAQHLRELFVEHDNPEDPFRTAAVGRYHLDRILAAAHR